MNFFSSKYFDSKIIGPYVFKEAIFQLSQFITILDRIIIFYDIALPISYIQNLQAQCSAQSVKSEAIPLIAGETYKTLESTTACYEKLQSLHIDRYTVILAIGGGVITDLVGFIASTYLRGCPFVSIPTTLMGMVDAAIGGKNGVNLPRQKNAVGTFYFPHCILIDPTMLNSLPDRQFKNGLAEAVKYGVIADEELFFWIKENALAILHRDAQKVMYLIQKCVAIKEGIVLQDPYETKSVRSILNWGHTFAHAIETLTGYNKLLHGEAVAIGMSCAAHLSYILNRAPLSFIELQDQLLLCLGLPLNIPNELSIEAIAHQMKTDKKNSSGSIQCIISNGIGQRCEKIPVQPEVIIQALKNKRQRD